jgi:hypothetical protein
MKNNILSLPVLILLFLLWIIPGLVGREPWKADEPYSFNLVYHMMQSGDWVVPSLTGEPFLEKPPLFFLTAAGFGRLFSPPLELYDASRLAAAFYMFLALLFFALAARELYGTEYTAIAVILLLGCVHLQVTGHKLITDVSLFTGFSIALYGLALCSRRRTAGGFWTGTGTGIGFSLEGCSPPASSVHVTVLPALPTMARKTTVYPRGRPSSSAPLGRHLANRPLSEIPQFLPGMVLAPELLEVSRIQCHIRGIQRGIPRRSQLLYPEPSLAGLAGRVAGVLVHLAFQAVLA